MWLWKDTSANWYHHKPDPVCHTEKYKLSWDFRIQLDHYIEHNKPDIVLLNKEHKSCIIVDVACPSDTRIISKNLREKTDNYRALK